MWPDQPARTLMAHLGKDTYSHIHYDSAQARTISVREAARLQSFPDGFSFCGTMNPAFRQIGNAVPPLMAKALATSIFRSLAAGRGRSAAEEGSRLTMTPRTDVVEPAVRSRMMSEIRRANTKPEVSLRKALFALGLRFRLHESTLPGRPDIVFPKYRAVVFVNGCFWHGHECRLFKWPRSNVSFWRNKIEGNMRRDRRTRRQLAGMGWRVRTVWECSIRKESPQPDLLATRLFEWLIGGSATEDSPAS